jgi:hypothetical protein
LFFFQDDLLSFNTVPVPLLADLPVGRLALDLPVLKTLEIPYNAAASLLPSFLQPTRAVM